MQKILGQDGYKIKTIFNNATLYFDSPYIIHDIMKPKEVKPEVETYTAEEVGNLNVIENQAGIILWAAPLDKTQTWAPRQRARYYLRKNSLPEDAGSKKALKIPINHVLQVDRANRKIRLIGDYISPNKKETDWVYY